MGNAVPANCCDAVLLQGVGRTNCQLIAKQESANTVRTGRSMFCGAKFDFHIELRSKKWISSFPRLQQLRAPHSRSFRIAFATCSRLPTKGDRSHFGLGHLLILILEYEYCRAAELPERIMSMLLLRTMCYSCGNKERDRAAKQDAGRRTDVCMNFSPARQPEVHRKNRI